MGKLVGGRDEVQELPKGPGYLGRPSLKVHFSKDIIDNRKNRDDKVREAVAGYDYSRSEVASFLGIYGQQVNERTLIVKTPKACWTLGYRSPVSFELEAMAAQLNRVAIKSGEDQTYEILR